MPQVPSAPLFFSILPNLVPSQTFSSIWPNNLHMVIASCQGNHVIKRHQEHSTPSQPPRFSKHWRVDSWWWRPVAPPSPLGARMSPSFLIPIPQQHWQGVNMDSTEHQRDRGGELCARSCANGLGSSSTVELTKLLFSSQGVKSCYKHLTLRRERTASFSGRKHFFFFSINCFQIVCVCAFERQRTRKETQVIHREKWVPESNESQWKPQSSFTQNQQGNNSSGSILKDRPILMLCDVRKWSFEKMSWEVSLPICTPEGSQPPHSTDKRDNPLCTQTWVKRWWL